MTHEGVDKLMRDAVESHRRIRDQQIQINRLQTENWIRGEERDQARARIRELEAELHNARRRENALTDLGALLSQELDRASARITELERVERVAAGLMARLATLGTVIAHDDAARILRDALARRGAP